MELLGLGCKDEYPWQRHGEKEDDDGGGWEEKGTSAKVEVTESVREWDYGDYEGITSREIQERREERGEGEWDIWRDGCPGGE